MVVMNNIRCLPLWIGCVALVAACTNDDASTTTGPPDTGSDPSAAGTAATTSTTVPTPTSSGSGYDTTTSGSTGTADTGSSSGDAPPPPGCGNGELDPGEACDEGPGNGPTKACTSYCQTNVCGDGGVGPGEYCDDGNTADLDGCNAQCGFEHCGDGVVQPGEPCDDGDVLGDDDCNSHCQPAKCGDGQIQPSLGEACDDYPSVDVNDDCSDLCQPPVCGDGILQNQHSEKCDDGNLLNNDGCLVNCVLASCGDGHVNVGVEQCDDANKVDADACTNACTLPGCGDGVRQDGEACDDGNDAADDGCDPNCVFSVVNLAAGHGSTCALFQSGKVRCWGNNANGKLGLGDTVDRGKQPADLPTPFVPLGGVATQIASTQSSFCVLLGTGKVRCWGSNAVGSLGYGHKNNVGDEPGEMPPPDVDIGGEVVKLKGGASHMCALLADGKVRCWGYNVYGQLGLGHTNNVGDDPGEMPPPALDLGGAALDLSLGHYHGCVIQAGGVLRCWGQNLDGQLGQGNKLAIGDQPGEMPPPTVNVGGKVIQYGAGAATGCAILDTNKVRCWGDNSFGQLMIGSKLTIGDQPGEMPPADAAFGLDATVLEIQGGSGFMCFRGQTTTGIVACWGASSKYQLGYESGDYDIGDTPGEKVKPAALWTSHMGVGAVHACAVLDVVDNANMKPGKVRCWGSNESGALGFGGPTYPKDGATAIVF